ncbi:MAG: M43 family zinc metalloprotease [Bacteroidota bacterium]
MSPAELQNHYARVQSITSLLPHDTCLNRELSLVFHIVLDSMGQPGVSIADIDDCVINLNKVWKPICISFKRCSLNYVPNYNYNEWHDVYDEPTFAGNYYVDKTIDIVLVENIVLPGNAAGYADQMGHIVMKKNSLGGVVPIHEMGHLFGLPHTFEGPAPNALSTELVKRTNCYTDGDGFCDTEADPHPTGEVSGAHCSFQPGPKDASNDYYTPPLDNYMTYFSGCECRFTQEQYNFMALTFILSGTQLH